MSEVYFVITEILDTRKINSEIELDKVFQGELDPSGRVVYFTDKANVQWVFYVSDTCWLVDDPKEVKKRVTAVTGSYTFLSPYENIKKPIPFIIKGHSNQRREPVLVETLEIKRGNLKRVTLNYTIEAIETLIENGNLIPSSLKSTQSIVINSQTITYHPENENKAFKVHSKYTDREIHLPSLKEALKHVRTH